MIENCGDYIVDSFKTLDEAYKTSYTVNCIDDDKTKTFRILKEATNYYNAYARDLNLVGGYMELLQEKSGETKILESCGDYSLMEKKKKRKKKPTSYIVMGPGFPKINSDKFNHATNTGKCPTSGILGGEPTDAGAATNESVDDAGVPEGHASHYSKAIPEDADLEHDKKIVEYFLSYEDGDCQAGGESDYETIRHKAIDYLADRPEENHVYIERSVCHKTAHGTRYTTDEDSKESGPIKTVVWRGNNIVVTRFTKYYSLDEGTKQKKNGKWTNKGKEGEHGEFRTKKEADAQRRAMFASDFKESLNGDEIVFNEEIINTDDENEVNRAINDIENQRKTPPTIRIVDPLYDKNGGKLDEETLQRINGDKILKCNVCQARILFDPSSLSPSEDDPEVYNVGDVCCVCGNDKGYTLAPGEVRVMGDSTKDSKDTETSKTEETTPEEPKAKKETSLTPTERHLDLDDMESFDENSLEEALSEENEHLTIDFLSQTKRDTLVAEGTLTEEPQTINTSKIINRIKEQLAFDLEGLGFFEYYKKNPFYAPGDIQVDVEEDKTRLSIVFTYLPQSINKTQKHISKIREIIEKIGGVVKDIYPYTILSKYGGQYAGAYIDLASSNRILMHLTYVLCTHTQNATIEEKSYELKIDESFPDKLLFKVNNKLVEGYLKDNVLFFSKK